LIDKIEESLGMEDILQIYSIRVFYLQSGRTLIQRDFIQDESKKIYTETFFSTILFFSHEIGDKEGINTVIIEDKKVIIESAGNLVFIAVVALDYETHDAKRVLSHIRAAFLRKYQIISCNWQFDEKFNYFKDFEPLLNDIVKHFETTKVVIKIVLMGIDHAGKTTFSHVFAGTSYLSYLPTTGLDILRIEYRNKQIRLWDLGGQKQFRKLWPKFANEASGIIFVVDSATSRWVETKEVFEISKLFKLPFIIFANKQDLVERVQSIKSIAEQLEVPKEKIIKGSALLNEGVFETLDKLLDEIG